MAEKKLSLDEFLTSMNKSFGEGSLIVLGNANTQKVDCNPVGVYSIDDCMGGGFAKGRIIEIYGPESSGKTSLTLMAIAEAQKEGKICAFVDVEQAFDASYAKKLGVDLDKLVVNQPGFGEEALQILDKMIESGLFDIIVFDSIAAVTPKSELEDEMGTKKMGEVARLMAQALRKITAKTNETHTTVIFINQLREKIGIMFGNPETTTGGNAMKFYASQRIDVRKGQLIKEGDNVIGYLMKIKVIKNKIAAPFKETIVSVYYNEGVDKMQDLLEFAIKNGVVQKNGSWISYEGTNIAQGAQKAAQMLKDNPELVDEIISKLK
jgi:recombination protein RecA